MSSEFNAELSSPQGNPVSEEPTPHSENQSDATHPIPTKKRKGTNTQILTREPGKTLLPFSRVQKILKADEELPIVAREATFLISLATEEFIKQLTEEVYIASQRENRVTVQYRDVASVVRRSEKFMFLDEITPWQSPDPQPKRKTNARQEKDDTTRTTTMLDSFVQKGTTDARPNSQPPEDIIVNEDGTMTIG